MKYQPFNIRKSFARILVCCGLAATLAACGDDDDAGASSDFSVVRSDLTFKSKAATGEVEVRSTSAFTVSVNKDWCRATTSPATNGHYIVTVEVDKNTDFDTRNAIVTLENNGRRLLVPLTQAGAVWAIRGADSYATSDEDTTFVIPATLDFEYTVDMPEWAEGEEVSEGYRLHLFDNNTGAGREGKVTFTSRVGSKTISLRQFGHKSVTGTYEASFTNGEGQSETRNIEIVSGGTERELYLRNLCPGYDIPVSISSDGTLTIEGAKVLDDFESPYIFIVLHTVERETFTETGFDYLGTLTLKKTNDMLVPTFTFSNDQVTYSDMFGMESTATINGFSLITAALPNILFVTGGEVLGQYVGLKLNKVLN